MEKEKKFYKKQWFMWLTLILFAPVGIFCLWKYKHLSKVPAVIFTIIFGLMFLVVITPIDPKNVNTSVDTVSVTQSKKVATKTETPIPTPIPTPTLSEEQKAKIEADRVKAEADKLKVETEAKEKKAKEDYKNWIKAQFSLWDGSHTELVDLIKKNLNDAKSFEHVETTYVDCSVYLIIKMEYRAKNGFGAMMLQNVTAKADYKSNTIVITSQND